MSISQLILIITFLLFQQLADFKRRAAYIFSTDTDAALSSLSVYILRVLALIIFRPKTLDGVLWIMVLSSIVPVAKMALSLARTHLSIDSSIKLILSHLYYSRLFILASLVSWVWTQVPVFALGFMQGKESAALLVSIRGISNVANIMMEQLETKAVADWARMYHAQGAKSMKEAIRKLNSLAFIFWVAIMLVILLFGEQIITLVLGKLYAPYSLVLSISWVAYGIFYGARIYGIQYRTLGDNRIEFIAGIAGLLAALLASWLIIPLFHVSGAASVYIFIATSILMAQVFLPKKSSADV